MTIIRELKTIPCDDLIYFSIKINNMPFTIPVSKKDPNTIEIMHKHLNNQDLYGRVGRFTNFLPNIVCIDCDRSCSYNPLPTHLRTPAWVSCGSCGFVYFDAEKQT